MMFKGIPEQEPENAGPIVPPEQLGREEALVERGHTPIDDLYKLADALDPEYDGVTLSPEELQKVADHLLGCDYCTNGLVAYIYAHGLGDSPSLHEQEWWIKFQAEQER